MCSRNLFRSDGKCFSNSLWSYFSFISPTCAGKMVILNQCRSIIWALRQQRILVVPVLCPWFSAMATGHWRIRLAYRTATRDRRVGPSHGFYAHWLMRIARCHENQPQLWDTSPRRYRSCTGAPNQNLTYIQPYSWMVAVQSRNYSARW